MAFGWHLVDLDDEEKFDRRLALDKFAAIAQFSVIVPLLCVWFLYLFTRPINRRLYRGPRIGPNPGNPDGSKLFISLRRVLLSFAWWAGTPVGLDWGRRGDWLFGSIWAAWLLLLCVVQTGDDYWHLTKRFGIVAASQLPFHYLLALKTPYSPLSLLIRLSHEELNRIHQILGRIITIFFYLHGLFYLSAFIHLGTLLSKFQSRVVPLGLLGLICFTAIGTTALKIVRTLSYRVFYLTHVTLAALLLPVLFFHVHHVRLYIWETLAIYVFHTVLRFLATRNYTSTLTLVRKTQLIKISISNRIPDTWIPGSHVYISIAHPYRLSFSEPKETLRSLLSRLKSNPFTIASLPTGDNPSLMLIARVHSGTTQSLAALASRNDSTTIQLRLEGPYGAARWLPDFRAFTRVLIVAGGVGGTFGVPLYQSLVMNGEYEEEQPTTDARFVWFVRNREDMAWAIPENEGERRRWNKDVEVVVTKAQGAGRGAAADRDEVLRKNRLGRMLDEALPGRSKEEDIELEEREGLLEDADVQEVALKDEARDVEPSISETSEDLSVVRGRDCLKEYVDELFSASDVEEDLESVAVLVCGPPGMARAVRTEVGRWVRQGKKAFFHAEEFGL
ncbi:MAG: hypothetical protein M1820_009384 [Bogoriella megaspora]|nr:MAG: hypothetical protein M1820_009384 [Bogoriella megaspora]